MIDRSSAVQLKPSYEVLKKEAVDLEVCLFCFWGQKILFRILFKSNSRKVNHFLRLKIVNVSCDQLLFNGNIN